MLKYTNYVLKKYIFSNLLSQVIIFIKLARVFYVSRFRNVTLFLVRDHSERLLGSERSSALEGFRDWDSALTTEQGSWLRCTHRKIYTRLSKYCAWPIRIKYSKSCYLKHCIWLDKQHLSSNAVEWLQRETPHHMCFKINHLTYNINNI